MTVNAGAEPDKRWSKLIENLLQLSAVFAALLYGLLFLGYRAYYGRLRISPEEVGVDNGFLLVRSIGFIFIMACVAAAAGLTRYLSLKPLPWPPARRDVPRLATWLALSIGLGAYAAVLVPDNWPPMLGLAVVFAPIGVAYLSAALTQKGHPRAGLGVILALGTVLAVLVPTAAVVSRGLDSADHALRGEQVEPYSILGIPVLDVSADPVMVTWVGPVDQQPAEFGNARPARMPALLLGTGAQTVVVLKIEEQGSHTRLILPVASVSLTDRR